ncbi:hypothetical protein DIPPA_22628 [Diplonema papillatum]|nr:hypothetical protein DIPPA_22628 [Diplonema papillatum]
MSSYLDIVARHHPRLMGAQLYDVDGFVEDELNSVDGRPRDSEVRESRLALSYRHSELEQADEDAAEAKRAAAEKERRTAEAMRHAVLVRQAEAQGCLPWGAEKVRGRPKLKADAGPGGVRRGGGGVDRQRPPHVIDVLHSVLRRELVADRLQGLGFAS